MVVTVTTEAPQGTDADTVAVALLDGEEAPVGVPAEVGRLLESGEARASFQALAVTHAQGKRWLTVGMGKREDFTSERARVAAAKALERAKEISTRTLCWLAPTGTGADGAELAGALVEVTALADYSFERHKSADVQNGKETGNGPSNGHSNDKEPPKHLEKL